MQTNHHRCHHQSSSSSCPSSSSSDWIWSMRLHLALLTNRIHMAATGLLRVPSSPNFQPTLALLFSFLLLCERLNFGWLPLTKAGGAPRNPHVCSQMWEGDVVSDLGRGTTLRKGKEKAVSEKRVSSWKVGKEYKRWGFLFVFYLFLFFQKGG